MHRKLKRELLLTAVLSSVLVVLGVIHLSAGRTTFGLSSLFSAVCCSGLAYVIWRKTVNADPEEPDPK